MRQEAAVSEAPEVGASQAGSGGGGTEHAVSCGTMAAKKRAAPPNRLPLAPLPTRPAVSARPRRVC